ncbi:hypothetical protein [Gilvibacter sediminis]|uniref:hypothetical protein n=1 Tax=Gilvibacter sediminis TaxID=379071 RepID=UPI0023506B6A|nr:hypothetical protein [Gilvibacter sediminis]MDC7997806.1 hypothetical protein [Gilvibacter sediminis]
MMKKLLYVVLLGLLLASCSTEELNTEIKEGAKLTVFSSTDSSYLGTYKGTYAAFSSSKRGTVVINITETSATALLQFVDGSETLMTGTGSTGVTGMKTYSFNALEGSFNFSVAADGTLPTASSVSLTEGAGSIVLAKDVTATPIRLATGTFGCEDCGDHPVLSDENAQSSFIWNMILPLDEFGESLVITQVSFGDSWFVANGTLHEAYDKIGLLVYNDLSGSFPFGASGEITWDATQMFSLDGACIDVRGNWTMTSPSYEIEGWIKSDSSCNPL